MDFGSPVANQTAPTDFFGMLNQALNLKQAQQNLQTGAIQQQTAQAVSQQQQQTTQQRAAQANYFKNRDSSKYLGDDGTLDVEKEANDPAFKAAMGDDYLTGYKSLLGIKADQADSQVKVNNLGTQQMGLVNGTLGALLQNEDVKIASDPKTPPVEAAAAHDRAIASVEQSLGLLGKAVPATAPLAQKWMQQLPHVPPGKLGEALRTAQQITQGASEQAATQRGVYANVGGQQVNINPGAAAGVPGALTNTVSPESQPVQVAARAGAAAGAVAPVEADTQAFQSARTADVHAPRTIALATALKDMANQGNAAVANNPALAKTLRSFGIESEGVANTAIMEKLKENLAREVGSAHSDKEAAQINAMLPDVAKGPQAITAAADQIIQNAQYDAGKYSYMKKKGLSTNSFRGAADAENEYTRSTQAPPRPAAAQIPEGATARTKSGQSVVRRNGVWVPQ